MKGRQITQTRLARMTGVAQSTISEFLSGDQIKNENHFAMRLSLAGRVMGFLEV